VGKVKRVHLTQTYELTITVDVELPDDLSDEDMMNTLTDFPINATVISMWDELHEGEDTPEIIVGDLCVDSLVTINGIGTTIVTDENGDIILHNF